MGTCHLFQSGRPVGARRGAWLRPRHLIAGGSSRSNWTKRKSVLSRNGRKRHDGRLALSRPSGSQACSATVRPDGKFNERPPLRFAIWRRRVPRPSRHQAYLFADIPVYSCIFPYEEQSQLLDDHPVVDSPLRSASGHRQCEPEHVGTGAMK